MVRFIINEDIIFSKSKTSIYIPIWLDLLYDLFCIAGTVGAYLHSNMVRFIICGDDRAVCGYFEFTFQYG